MCQLLCFDTPSFLFNYMRSNNKLKAHIALTYCINKWNRIWFCQTITVWH